MCVHDGVRGPTGPRADCHRAGCEHCLAAGRAVQAADMRSLGRRAAARGGLPRNFENAFKRISKCSFIFSDIKGAMDRQSVLELETRTKDTRISTMQFLNKAQIKGFETRYSEWDKEKNRFRL